MLDQTSILLIHNFSNNLSFCFLLQWFVETTNGIRNKTTPLLPQNGRVTITRYSEGLSNVSVLHLTGLRQSDTGVYQCKAVCIQHGTGHEVHEAHSIVTVLGKKLKWLFFPMLCLAGSRRYVVHRYLPDFDQIPLISLIDEFQC